MHSDSEIIELLLSRKKAGLLNPDDPLLQGNNAPLSSDKIAEAETKLEFELPPLLHRIYSEIANGGFGESYGFLGLLGGPLNEDGDDAVTLYLNAHRADPEDKYWNWPTGLLPIVHLGCAMFQCVQCNDPNLPVIWFEPNVHDFRETWEKSFIPFSPSLSSYISAWLNEEDLWAEFMGDQ